MNFHEHFVPVSNWTKIIRFSVVLINFETIRNVKKTLIGAASVKENFSNIVKHDNLYKDFWIYTNQINKTR